MNRTLRRYLAAVLIPLLLLLMLAIDVVTPLSVADWLGYVALVLIVSWYGRSDLVLVLAGFSTIFMAAGYFLSPSGVPPWIALLNRTAGALLLWGAAFLMIHRRQLLAQLAEQAEALQCANEQLQEQTEELEAQSEELHSQNDELILLTDQLELRVAERTAQLQAANASLQEMSAQLLAVQENERRAMARELHDETSQLLTALSVGLRMLDRPIKPGESLADRIEELHHTADRLGDGIHRLAMNLRPASLDRAGLLVAVQQYIESYRHTYGLQIGLAAGGLDGERLSPEIETAVYRVIQEALTNVVRHAHATQVGVTLERRPDSVLAVIEDDGSGFDPAGVADSGRLGLIGMRERAEILGGTLTIESERGAGTSIFIKIPCGRRGSS